MSTKTIGTHDGVFHCDEVFAITMLRLLPDYSQAQITRTRDQDKLKTCDIVVDVGGVYDHSTLRYDHHQATFNESMSTLVRGAKWKTKLSSAGLIYAHYGKNVIAEVIGKDREDAIVKAVYNKMYANFVQEIDGIDNGVAPYTGGDTAYKVTSTISNRVALLNPSWREENPQPLVGFNKALDLVKAEFLAKLKYFAGDWWDAIQVVEAAVEHRLDVDESGQIIELGNGGCPWKGHLVKTEKKLGITKENQIKYVIYGNGDAWKVQAVPVSPESFMLRKAFPRNWLGKAKEELVAVTQIPTAEFVHTNGFLAVAKDIEGALQMARAALANKG